MRLEHVNIVVKDIQRSLTFYQAAFPHWQIRDSGDTLWYGYPRKWVHFGDDYNYLTLNDGGTGINRDLAGSDLGLAHFAFVTLNLDDVRQRLQNAGYEPHNLGANELFRKNLYFLDPDGFEIEFVQYLSDIPAQRNLNQD